MGEDICVSFRVIREIDVEDAKPGTVQVYDYYQTELSVNKKYTLPPNDECLSIMNRQPIDDLIIEIEEEILIEEEPNRTTGAPVDNEAIEDLIGALDEMV